MPKRAPIESSLVSRIASGLRYALTGAAPNEWFGPMDPIGPAVKPEQAEQAGVAGRQFDYRSGYNTSFTPRTGEPISFPQLRALAESYDPLRLVIETRKDQVCSLKWGIKPKGEKAEPDARCEALEAFFACPDKEHTWDEWLRLLLEDLFVIDAPTLYIRRTNGGDLYSLDPVDGATIFRVIDATGRTPIEGTAYQQVLKGVPAADYTREELIYKPRNIRTHKIYGLSPVEQIINIVNIALRRQLFTLEYFTSGTVPDALAGVPAEWSVQQIGEFQRYWDEMLQDDMEARRKLKFVPGEIAKNFKETKQPPLKDMFDEWLMRIVCYCFSIDPTPFVAQVNRSVAETTREQSLSEGLSPIKQWIKSLVDRVIVQCYGYTDIEFAWEDQVAIDPLVQAQINKVYLDAKVLHPDEVRADLGRDPLTPEQKEDLNPPPPPMLGGPEAGNEPPPKQKPEEQKLPEKEALGKAKKALPQIDRERSAVTNARDTLTATITDFLTVQKQKITAQIIEALGLEKSSQSGTPGNKAARVVDDIDFDDWAVELYAPMQKALAGVVVDGGGEALKQLGVFDDDVLSAVSANAEEWAANRAAEMVGMKWVDGELIPNPDAQWQITEGTREFLRADVSAAMDEGLGANELASRLSENYAFSDTRAEVISRTETARADIAGSQIGWQSSGLVSMREWNAAPECCDECQSMHGERASIDGPFKGGADVPLHPNCFVSDTVVSAAGVSTQYKRWFEGEVVVISAAGVDEITVTPNHPVLTDKGWVAAGLIQDGDKLIHCADPAAVVGVIDPDNNHVETRIDEVSGSGLMALGVTSDAMPMSAEAFHGDGIADSKVNVVRPTSLLSGDGNAELFKATEHGVLGLGHIAAGLLNSNGTAAKLFKRDLSAAHSLVSGSGVLASGGGIGICHSDSHGLATVSDTEPAVYEGASNGEAVTPNRLGNSNAGFSGEVSRVEVGDVRISEAALSVSGFLVGSGLESCLVEAAHDNLGCDAESGCDTGDGLASLMRCVDVLNVRKHDFAGHVYNLETNIGWYFANGVIAHNCRCDVLPVLDE